jgi:hypothetical protein
MQQSLARALPSRIATRKKEFDMRAYVAGPKPLMQDITPLVCRWLRQTLLFRHSQLCTDTVVDPSPAYLQIGRGLHT